jgi:phenylacetate-coenzyme A ligase PaaK-like adenylate-forming protein
MFQEIRDKLMQQVSLHTHSKDAILKNQAERLTQMVTRLNDEQKTFWFNKKKEYYTAEDLFNKQIENPPFGIHTEMSCWPRTSSGTSGSNQLKFPYSFDQILQAGIGPARAFDRLGVSNQDTMFIYDPGRMVAGHLTIKIAFSLICNGKVVENQMSTIKEKVQTCVDYNVNFISGVPNNLVKLANYMIEKKIKMNLKAYFYTGYAILPEQIALCNQAFGCKPLDFYGLVECGNVFWQCTHGNKHVNVDLTMVENIKDKTLFTGLSVMPVFKYYTGDTVEYRWLENPCGCGSFLPVVTKFSNKLKIEQYQRKE